MSSFQSVLVAKKLSFINPGHLIYDIKNPVLVSRVAEFEAIDTSEIMDVFYKPTSGSEGYDCGCKKEQSIAHGYLCEDGQCLNRATQVECDSGRCKMGQQCKNRRLQKKEYAPFELFETDKNGIGVKALLPIKRDDLIAEYIGEIIGMEEFLKRDEEYKAKGGHYYMSKLVGSFHMDATKKGNCSRFLNHSCSPNCLFEKWTVNGRTRIAFFALRDIKAGEELTLDYESGFNSNVNFICNCGAPNCVTRLEEPQPIPQSSRSQSMDQGSKIVTTPKTGDGSNKRHCRRLLFDPMPSVIPPNSPDSVEIIEEFELIDLTNSDVD